MARINPGLRRDIERLSDYARRLKFSGADPDLKGVASYCLDAPGSSGNMVATVDWPLSSPGRPVQPLPHQLWALRDRCLVATRAGSNFMDYRPETLDHDFGILRIGASGRDYSVVWGLVDDGQPTSELPAQLAIVEARLARGDSQVVSLHDHSIHAQLVCRLLSEGQVRADDIARANGESSVYMADGVGFVEYYENASIELAEACQREFSRYQAVVWDLHGSNVVGASIEDAMARREHFTSSLKLLALSCLAGARPRGIRGELFERKRQLARSRGL